jgi:hypothetical protein
MTDSQIQLAAPARTSPLAIVALVAGIAGWTFFPVIGGVVAVITGHLARDEIRKSQGRLGGDSMATAGLILGYACLAVALLVVVLAILFFGIFDLGVSVSRSS